MAQAPDATEMSPRILVDLSALADGTLDETRAQPVRELIRQSPELRRRYERERRAVSALHILTADRAPARVRIAIDRGRRPARARRSRPVVGGAIAAVAAAVAVAILFFPGGTSLSVTQAAAVGLRGPVLPPPPPAQTAGRLTQDVEDIYFPDWSVRFGWRASGQRIDRIDGRLAITVFYRRGGKQVAYTILASPALASPKGQTRVLNGVKLRRVVSNDRLIVIWRRADHTCVLSAAGVAAGELSRLAAWRAPGLSR